MARPDEDTQRAIRTSSASYAKTFLLSRFRWKMFRKLNVLPFVDPEFIEVAVVMFGSWPGLFALCKAVPLLLMLAADGVSGSGVLGKSPRREGGRVVLSVRLGASPANVFAHR